MAGCDQLREREFSGAIFFERQRKSRRRAGNADPERGIARFGIVGLAVGPKENRRCGRRRRRLAIVDRDVFMLVDRMNDHEAAAADIAGAWIGHCHGKAGSNRRIDGVAAALQDVGADARRDLFLRHHHAVFGRDGMNGVGGGRSIEAAALLLRIGGRKTRATAGNRGKVSRQRVSNGRINISPRELREREGPTSQRCYMVGSGRVRMRPA